MGILLIAKDNIKKQKGNATILFLLVALAVFMLYVGISVLSNMDQVIDKRNEAVNGADYFLFSESTHSSEIMDFFEKKDEVTYVEREEALFVSSAKYFSDTQLEKDADEISFFFQDIEAERKLSVIKVHDEGKVWKENSIILPYYMKVGMGYQTGETLNIEINNKIFYFEIYGFTEDIMFSTTAIIAMEKGFISNHYYKDIEKELGSSGYMYRTKLKKDINVDDFLEKNNLLKDIIPDYISKVHLDLDYELVKYGASITANIFMAILTIFAILIIFIALVIVHFNINNTIEMNMKNIGILQASGYTCSQLAVATVVEFLSIGAVGMAVGLGCAKGASDMIGGTISSAIGLCWEMGFDLISALLSIGIITFLILFGVFLSSRRYWKIVPLYALRNGIYTHNFKKNHIRLDKTKLPLNAAIGMKQIWGNLKKNISICFIVVILTFIGNMSVSLYQNLVSNTDKMFQIIGMEGGDIRVLIQTGEEDINIIKESVKSEIAHLDGMKQIVELIEEDMMISNDTTKVSVNCDICDNPNNLRVNNIVEGKRPEYDNEIMLSTVIADKLDVSIGEVVYLELNEGREDYLVVGISQGINHLGRKAMITADGALRLNENLTANTLLLYVNDATSIENTIETLNDTLENYEVSIVNSKKEIDITLISIISTMKILCIVMAVVIAFVIALVLVLLVKTQLIRQTRQFAIYKALGYTTVQLIWQITMSYIPVFFVGTLVGCGVAFLGITPSVVLSLSAFGIKSFAMDLSFTAMLGIVVTIVVWSEIIIVLCSTKIRKITPYEMQQ